MSQPTTLPLISVPFEIDVPLMLETYAAYRYRQATGIDGAYSSWAGWPMVTIPAVKFYEAPGCSRVEYRDGEFHTKHGSFVSAVSATTVSLDTTLDDSGERHYPKILALRDAQPTRRIMTDDEANFVVNHCLDTIEASKS